MSKSIRDCAFFTAACQGFQHACLVRLSRKTSEMASKRKSCLCCLGLQALMQLYLREVNLSSYKLSVLAQALNLQSVIVHAFTHNEHLGGIEPPSCALCLGRGVIDSALCCGLCRNHRS